MICNTEVPMCIGGVFGGLDSGVTEQTTDIFLEAAYFHPTWIRKTARRFGLNTDASFHFERGIDPNDVIYNLKLAALLVKELAGGEICGEIVDKKAVDFPSFPVTLSYEYVNSLIGKVLPVDTVKSILKSLEIEIVKESDAELELLVPTYRVDVQRPCDVVEDILRIYGYNNVEIPSAVKSCLSVVGEPDKSHRLQNIVGEQLVGAGFNEILNNSLQRGAYCEGLEQYKPEHSVKLMNPLSNDLNALRQTLLFGGLECIARNTNYKNPNLRLFEYGNCYRFDAARKCADIIPGVSSSRDPEVIKHVLDAYSEDAHLALWVTGKRVSGSWAHPDEEMTFAELKAHVMNVFYRIGLPMGMLVFAQGTNDIYDKSILVQNRGGKTLAEMGIVSQSILQKFGIEAPVYFADLQWNALMKAIRNQHVTYREISKYPAVSRDLALLLDEGVEFAEIEKIAYQTEKKLLKAVTLFDVYEGKNLPAGKKSYAVNFILQDESKTLTDKAIEAIMNKLTQNLTKQLQAELR